MKGMKFSQQPKGEKGAEIMPLLSSQSKIEKESVKSLKALKLLLTNAVEVDQRLQQQFLFSRNLGAVRDFLERDFFASEIGIVREGTVTKTTRDGWGHWFGGPQIEFRFDEEGMFEVLISGNAVAGTDFQFEVIPGVNNIVINYEGRIFAVTQGDRRALEKFESEQLAFTLEALVRKLELKMKAITSIQPELYE